MSEVEIESCYADPDPTKKYMWIDIADRGWDYP
jgi:hypothetical protein